MVDLRANPYYLSDEDIAWVENTIADMTDEEKTALKKQLDEAVSVQNFELAAKLRDEIKEIG